ncbi:MAG: hypothetical protein GXP29_14240 [Planctomycetes bacterium]|nr:hypothetical protein [Planctomycetota bacterium]
MMTQSQSGIKCALFAVVVLMLGSSSSSTALGGASPSPFTEEAAARGLSYLAGATSEQFGAGVCISDLDNDGDPDVVVGGAVNGQIGLFENDGTGNFIDRWVGSGIPLIAMPSSITAADFDSDGDLDLHISNFLAPDLLLRNDGNFTFVDIAAAAGVDSDGAAQGVAWGDCNGDGRLDFYVCNRTGHLGSTVENHFFVNNGNSTFTDLAASYGVQAAGEPTLMASFFDYDLDGDADLYLGTDKGSLSPLTNHLFQNSNGSYDDVTSQTNTEANVDCMGIAFGDWTRNGFPDFYVTNTPPGNVLLLQQPDNTFIDYSVQSNTGSFAIGWSTFFFDYDNDRWLELYGCNTGFPTIADAGNRLYEHDGVWPAVDLGPALGVDTLSSNFTAAFGDLDGDGDLDLIVPASGTTFPLVEEPIRVFINNEGQKRNWAKFDVVGTDSNGFALGTRLNLRLGADWLIREVIAGCNYKSQNDLNVHFGLGSATVIDELQVNWPDGSSRTLTNYPANRKFKIYPSSRLGDLNQDGNFDLADLPAFAACVDGPVTASIPVGCELADLNSDGAIDLDDYAELAIQQGS